MIRTNLGALFSSGFRIKDIESMNWEQIMESSACVQQYHLDLAARIMTGKSPALEEAKKGRPRVQGPQAAQRTESEQANQESNDELMRLKQSQLAEGSTISFKEAKAGSSRDLLQEWKAMNRSGKADSESA